MVWTEFQPNRGKRTCATNFKGVHFDFGQDNEFDQSSSRQWDNVTQCAVISLIFKLISQKPKYNFKLTHLTKPFKFHRKRHVTSINMPGAYHEIFISMDSLWNLLTAIISWKFKSNTKNLRRAWWTLLMYTWCTSLAHNECSENVWKTKSFVYFADKNKMGKNTSRAHKYSSFLHFVEWSA